MTDPYRRVKNFQADLGNATDHGALNAELDAIATQLTIIMQKLNVLLKDDNTLQPELVTPGSLSNDTMNLMTGTDVLALFGPKGDTGASFRADFRGLASERVVFDGVDKGFCFLAMDTGELSFKLSDAHGDWSQAYIFAKGATGADGEPGEPGAPGTPGAPGAVALVDTNAVSAYLTGRSQITVQLLHDEDGRLSPRIITS